jgi:poly(3-hydroxyalkanoate) synthetase
MVEQNLLMKLLSEVSRPVSKPEWTTSNRIELETDNVVLRNFSTGKEDVPTLIIPPQAGHHSSIADYDKNQSLVECALNSGKKSVYVTEWKSATVEQKDNTIDDYIISQKKCVEAIGSKVNLIGLCQGGWQSAIYTALFPEDVNSLVLVAAPIDFRAGDSKIEHYIKMNEIFFPHDPLLPYKWAVALGEGNLKGETILSGFKMLNFADRYIKDFRLLWENIDDETYIKRFRKFKGWYEYTQNLSGAFYLQIVKDLFMENKLINGELEILNEKVDLKKIDHPLYLIAGETDDITVLEQMFNMENYVSSKKIIKEVVPAGHIGVFMGTKIVRDYWPKIFKSI